MNGDRSEEIIVGRMQQLHEVPVPEPVPPVETPPLPPADPEDPASPSIPITEPPSQQPPLRMNG
jgi:hypothetical protein